MNKRSNAFILINHKTVRDRVQHTAGGGIPASLIPKLSVRPLCCRTQSEGAQPGNCGLGLRNLQPSRGCVKYRSRPRLPLETTRNACVLAVLPT